MAQTSLLEKYADRENEQKAIWQFRDRMREQRGLERPAFAATEPYVPGLYKEFVPDFTPQITYGPGRAYYAKKLVFWSGVTALWWWGLLSLI